MEDLLLKETVLYILDHIEEGVHIIDKEGKIIYHNSSVQEIDGLLGDDIIGRHLLEVYPSLREDTSTLLTSMKTGQPIYKRQQSFINYNGKRITTINTSIPIKKEGNILGAIEISQDITNVKEMSEKIVDLQDKLYNRKKPSELQEYAKYTFEDIIGQNKEILRLKDLGKRAAKGNASILIWGDTGTGKELFVHSIHNSSPRHYKPFIAQNCAALPGTLLEGILFGTAKGGFTGAEDRPGLFELANGGTLFLDEINSMPLDLQSKLLRVLQDGNIRRVGGTSTINVDVRIIGATNIPPEEAIEKEQLRKDLYYRLNVINFQIPSLKNRKDDIPILVEHFIDKFNKNLNKNVKGVSKEAMELFYSYPWEGNIRELEHLIEGIMSINDMKIIDKNHLPPKIVENQMEETIDILDKPLNTILEETERKIIKEALKRTNNNITKAAELLKIPRQTLQYRLSKLNLK